MPELSPDTLLHHRYRIKRVISYGGMGNVYEAFDENLERTVAIKQNGDLLPGELFLKEAKLLAKLRHPHLPAAIEVFEEQSQQFFVMDYIEGADLDQLLTSKMQFTVDEISEWLVQILDALNYLHTRNPPVIHRDIKPSNLILSNDTIFLVDFGISKDNNRTLLSGSGTRQYSSPEHTTGSTTPESDLYSLSATIYHLLTGRPVPPADVRWMEVYKKERSDPLVPAHMAAPMVSQAVSNILSKGLSLDPQDRFHSAMEMRRAFEAAVHVSQSLVSALDPRSVDPADAGQNNQVFYGRQVRQRLPAWVWWAIPMVALLLLGGAMLRWASQDRPSGDPPLTSVPVAMSSSTPAAAPALTSLPAATPTPTTQVPDITTSTPAVPTTAPTPVAPPASVAPASAPPIAAIESPPARPPASTNTIRIAVQSPLTGEWGTLGTGIMRGSELSILQQNRPLTDLGFQVEFMPFDDRALPEQGKANAEAIVADPAALCVVGHYNSGVTLAAQPIYAAANLVQISPGSTNPQVTDSNDNIWRVVGRDDVQGTVAARFTREVLKSQRPFIIHDDTPYGRGIAEFFRQDMQANGTSVTGFQMYDDTQETVDFTPLLNEIQTINPDVIYFAGSYNRAGVFFKQARERGITAQFIGSDSLDSPELAKIAGGTVDGMHFTTVAAPVKEFPQARKFAEDYKAKFGQDAPPFSPEGYDATTLCIQAIARAARANGGYPTRQQVLEAMRNLPAFQGISGNYRFNPNGDPQSVGYFIVQVNAQDWNANRVVQQLLVSPR